MIASINLNNNIAMNNKNVAGVVILYNPGLEVIYNISTFVHQVDKLYIVDNSKVPSQEIVDEILKQFKNVNYICNKNNFGIATALNQAVEKAICDEFKFLLTMDQDTTIPDLMVEKLYETIKSDTQVGIISPHHNNDARQVKIINKKIKSVLTVMTCGNIINLKAIKEVGGFENKLFIDYVDHDICLRLVKNNYKILQDNSFSLIHKLGNRKVINLWVKKITPSNHDSVRIFYRTRNRFYVYKKNLFFYPKFVVFDFLKIFKEVSYLILFEKNKIIKIKMMLLGFIRFLKNQYGVIDFEVK
jgi:rhamnosyltransferase